MGETRTFSGISGIVNSSTSQGWEIVNKSGFLPPDYAGIDQDGCLVYHHWDETAGGDSQIHNYPGINFRNNVSLGVDMSEYFIKLNGDQFSSSKQYLIILIEFNIT